MRWSGPLFLAAGSMLDQSATTLIDAAAAAGFDGVGLRLSGEHGNTPPGELRRRAADVGLTIFDAEVHRITIEAIDPEPLLDAAATAGAHAVLVVSDHPDRPTTIEVLCTLMTKCQARRLRVGLEYMAWTDPNTPHAAIDIAEQVGCELIVDVLHHLRVGAGPAELDAVVRSGRLGWVQLCDAPLARPDSPSHKTLLDEARHGRLPPGHGELPLENLLACLPHDVTISVEAQSDRLLSLPPTDRARLLFDATRTVLARATD